MRFEKLDLNLLVALDALLKHKNVSLAAKELHLTQPALSSALTRLRDYFSDELLVINSGKKTFLTEKANSLENPVREVLLQIKNSITTEIAFNPATSKRHFNIVAADATLLTFLSTPLAAISKLAPGLTFDIFNLDVKTFEMLETGETDLFFIIDNFTRPDHPSKKIYQDDYCVICCAESAYSKAISHEEYLKANHAVVFFGDISQQGYNEIYLDSEGIKINITLRLPNYSTLPKCIIDSDRIATVPKKLAKEWKKSYPINILPVPIEMPVMTVSMQWHRSRESDTALAWLIELFEKHATYTS
ncbi:MAG: nodulation protein NfeD [SAR86 cluster bacterium]|uniref:Nodulation protein NfeD n=1 Tax=SAR86 cluster bacterium TaxID=2030880 RepID=A0A2A5CGL7_9GAMM|nr:LysR family transcriptional regulator [Gammaproteobacteria bacterium AH-315-E17]PCJ42678.1 MAG: nodulation protein NfeD [SAR86 cluster bacterium]